VKIKLLFLIFAVTNVSLGNQLGCGGILIKNPSKVEEFEQQIIKKRKPDFRKNLAIVEAMYQEARNMGVFGRDPLDGLEVDLKIARIINHVRKTS